MLADFIASMAERARAREEPTDVDKALIRITETTPEEDDRPFDDGSAVDELRKALQVSRYRAGLHDRLNELRRDHHYWQLYAEGLRLKEQWEQIPLREPAPPETIEQIGTATRDIHTALRTLSEQEAGARVAAMLKAPPLTMEDLYREEAEPYDEAVLQIIHTSRMQLTQLVDRKLSQLKDVHPNDLLRAYTEHVLQPWQVEMLRHVHIEATYRMELLMTIADCHYTFPRFRAWADQNRSVEELAMPRMANRARALLLPRRLPSMPQNLNSFQQTIDQTTLVAIFGSRLPAS